MIADQIAGAFAKGRRLPQLLSGLRLLRMASDRGMYYTPGRQFDDGEHKNVPEPESVGLQEITRPDGRSVVR